MDPQDAADDNATMHRGITLLEVLIACGLLVVGLSTVASLLPASGQRLAQANLEDRAAMLVTNALAEVTNRRLVAAACFPTPAAATSGRTLAFGSVLDRLASFGEVAPGRRADSIFAALSDEGRSRCGSPRTFLLEDELSFSSPSLSMPPANRFTEDDFGLGPRLMKQRMCWGATLTPKAFPVKAGGIARLTIAVFKKAGEILPLTLTRREGFFDVDASSISEAQLRPCTWLLALGSSGTQPPEWFQLMSSWTTPSSPANRLHLIFRDQPGFEALTGANRSDATAYVILFEGLVRVDECLVPIR